MFDFHNNFRLKLLGFEEFDFEDFEGFLEKIFLSSKRKSISMTAIVMVHFAQKKNFQILKCKED